MYNKADGIALVDCVGRCYCHVAMYIATDMWITVVRLMLLPVEDGKSTMWEHYIVADVIARWEDGKSTMWEHYVWQMLLPGGEWTHQGGGWQMLQPSGRWNSHCIILVLVLGCPPEPHPIYVADGICPHFYWGMDHLFLCTMASLIALLRFWSSFPTMCEIFPIWCCDQWWYNGQKLGMGPFGVLWTFHWNF